jgi:SAM-dependent methyltransferase
MNNLLRNTYKTLTGAGLDPLAFCRFLRGIPAYLRNLVRFRRLQRTANTPFHISGLMPFPGDRYLPGGSASGHYFHQDLLVAQKIFKKNPERHLDIGSRIDGFVAHIAAFREIEVLDIRPQPSVSDNITFRQFDLMQPPPDELIDCTDSLSCLHTLEHLGLGRYGDSLDPAGYLTGLKNLTQILKPGGTLYLSVPIGMQRIEFDGHRVFDAAYIVELLSPGYTMRSFSFVDDRGSLHKNVPVEQANDCIYGCGIFEAVRKEPLLSADHSRMPAN